MGSLSNHSDAVEDVVWKFSDDRVLAGPYSLLELHLYAQDGTINSSTVLMHENGSTLPARETVLYSGEELVPKSRLQSNLEQPHVNNVKPEKGWGKIFLVLGILVIGAIIGVGVLVRSQSQAEAEAEAIAQAKAIVNANNSFAQIDGEIVEQINLIVEKKDTESSFDSEKCEAELERIEQISLEGCPEDFSFAFIEFRRAYIDVRKVEVSLIKAGDDAVPIMKRLFSLGSLGRETLTGDYADKKSKFLEKRDKMYYIAEKYGVEFEPR